GASVANAELITDWGYSTTNVFENATFSSGNGTTTENPQSLSWGGVDAEDRSSVSIDDVNAPSGLITNGDFVDGGLFTHDNNIIDARYSALTSFNIVTSLDLVASTPDNGATQTVGPLTFESSFSETINSAPCGGTSTGIPCDDIFTLNNLPDDAMQNMNGWFELSSDQFTIDDFTYTVFLELENLVALGATTCGVAGAPANCVGLLTQEDTANTFQTRFRIAAAPASVPEPGTLALMGLGIAGLGFARRKKAAKA
uniref:THxN family PEP-CTERM protein n=1 Tax=Marinobacter changyiensis TaxID=2604091 RepID=UPI00126472D6